MKRLQQVPILHGNRVPGLAARTRAVSGSSLREQTNSAPERQHAHSALLSASVYPLHGFPFMNRAFSPNVILQFLLLQTQQCFKECRYLRNDASLI